MNAFSAVLAIFAVTSLVVGGVVIANVFAITLVQRSRDTALLRILGARSGQVRTVALIEALGLAVAGSVLGIPVGIASARLVVALFNDAGVTLPPTTAVVHPRTIVFGSVKRTATRPSESVFVTGSTGMATPSTVADACTGRSANAPPSARLALQLAMTWSPGPYDLRDHSSSLLKRAG